MQAGPIREYRIAPELRRCCWYVLASIPALLSILLAVEMLIRRRGVEYPIVGCIFFIGLAAAMVAVLRWRLALEPDGLARRRLGYWDHWSWADLASGRIGKVYPATLVDPERPWWRRRLSLGCLCETDRQEVLAEVNRHYRLPPPPEVPESLTIRYGFRRQAAFDRTGVHLLVRGMPCEYSWRDVRRVLFMRMDPLCRTFWRLVVLLPDQNFELKMVNGHGGAQPSWRGATAEQVNECLLRHLVPEQVETIVGDQLPKSREVLTKDLATATRDLRNFRTMAALYAPVLVGTLIWLTVAKGMFGGLLLSGMMTVFVVPTSVFTYRRLQNRVVELQSAYEAAGDD